MTTEQIMKKPLLLIIFSIFLFNSNLPAQLSTIRIAYYPKGERLDSGFIIHARKYKYQYIAAEFRFKNVAKPMEKIYSEINYAYKITDQNNTRLIPKIQINSCWSSHWRHVRDNDNQQMEINFFLGKLRKQIKLRWWGCPSFAPDSIGIDKSFEDLVKTIVSAHDSANTNYPLEFIHLGHDEPTFYKYMLIGGVCPGKHGINILGSWYISDKEREFSQKDRNWIKAFIGSENYTDENISLAFQALIINSLYRKVKTIKKYSPKTKVMIYADAWDPCMNGINSFRTSFKRKKGRDEYCVAQLVPDTSKGIATLPGLTDEEKKFLRENVILLPWNYYGVRAYAGINPVREDYDTYKTFSYLAKNDFKFIYTFELLSKNQSWPPDKRRTNQMYEFVNTAQLFKKNCLGYMAAHWDAKWDNPKHKDCFRTMEELYKTNQKVLNKN